tara:strand:+ start:4017 stop:4307 length:291 start_codon:yes stop_codon:yes gene_type:complete
MSSFKDQEEQCNDCKIEAKEYCDICGGYGTECQLGNSASCGCPSCVEKEEDEDDDMVCECGSEIKDEGIFTKNFCDKCCDMKDAERKKAWDEQCKK